MQITKKRSDLVAVPILPDIGKILRSQKGNKVSRFFRHIFEHKSIKKIFGANMALMIVASSFLPGPAADFGGSEDIIVQAQAPLTTQAGVQNPVAQPTINQGYSLFHPGYDFEGLTGDPVYPIMAGVVAHTEYSRYAYGNSVIVSHGNGITTLYAHLSQINVQKGQEVNKQTTIGEVGSTGRSTGDHLHIEVRDHGYPINPGSVLPR
jgi:murein DD-endopeptidase MepM/ murein hydrolase activator NlpD